VQFPELAVILVGETAMVGDPKAGVVNARTTNGSRKEKMFVFLLMALTFSFGGSENVYLYPRFCIAVKRFHDFFNPSRRRRLRYFICVP
jgi:hypothetical protein